jgi:hypothetical protein
MKFPTPPPGMTEAEIDADIEEAFAELVRKGLIVPTGKTKWSERKQRLVPAYMRVPPAAERH